MRGGLMRRSTRGADWLAVAGAVALVAAGCTRGTRAPSSDGGADAPFVIVPDGSLDAGPTCDVGEIDCFGTCTHVAGDSLNCGSCGNACPEGTSCAAGRCDCLDPKISCDGICLDPSADVSNCGSCGNECTGIEMCSSGTCIIMCDPPNTICFDRDPDDTPVAVCSDLVTDDANCGRCNTRCSGGASCVDGRCRCAFGELNCDGYCVDPATDTDNCGSCGNSCGAGGVCVDSACESCGTGLTGCSGRCIDTMTDRFHCGMCGRPCGAGEACSGGLCECAGTLVDCGSGCTDLDTDIHNCGTCGVDCGVGGVCTAGACTCASGYTMCGLSCRDTRNDHDNCGACDMVCDPGLYCVMSECTDAPPTRYMQTAPAPGSVPFVDACTAAGHTAVLPTTDDGSTRVALPFAFRYWATDLPAASMINLCSNGWMGMAGDTSASLGGTVPSTTAPNAVIAPHWGDDVTGASGICVATVGTAPNRRWVVEWAMSRYFAGSGENLTYEVILSEGTGTIDLVYGTMTGARAQTMGIEDQTGMMGINACPGGTGGCIPTTGQVVRFVPIP